MADESTDRRSFFRSLIAAGAVPRKTRKHVKHSDDVRLYHGPMVIPAHVAEAVREDPTPMRAAGRGSHLMSRYAEPGESTVYVFRCAIPAHRTMIGDIRRTALGRIRVSCWSACDPAMLRGDRKVEGIIAYHTQPPIQTQDHRLILPPLTQPSAEWHAEERVIEESSGMMEYTDYQEAM